MNHRMVHAVRLGMIATLALVLVIAGATPLSAQQAAPASTSVRLLVPFVGNALQPGLTIARRASGECWTGSVASQGRSDAWRCMAGNAILDPCYQNIMASRPTFACMEAPWSTSVVLFTATGAPPQDKANKGSLGNAMPWALQLVTGARCTFMTGATAGIAGMRMNYGCPDGTSVIGDIDRTQPLWRAFAVPPRGASAVLTGIAVAWY